MHDGGFWGGVLFELAFRASQDPQDIGHISAGLP